MRSDYLPQSDGSYRLGWVDTNQPPPGLLHSTPGRYEPPSPIVGAIVVVMILGFVAWFGFIALKITGLL
ncbi:MAG TPA: hypothetical protein VFV66_24860 [Nonomuraea sp.]|nr:hypothetical protein [Nonomuraea sp.]